MHDIAIELLRIRRECPCHPPESLIAVCDELLSEVERAHGLGDDDASQSRADAPREDNTASPSVTEGPSGTRHLAFSRFRDGVSVSLRWRRS